MKVKKLTVGPIVGATTDSSARIWGRGKHEDIDSRPRRCFGVARIKSSNVTKFSNPRFFKMNPNFDLTGVVHFDGLSPEKSYDYQIGCFFSDLELDALPSDFPLDWEDVDIMSFKTASNNTSRERSFVFGSCRYLLRLLGGSWFDNRGDKTFRSILEQINDKKMRTDQFIMLGDQIYADDLRIVFQDEQLEEYNKRYRDVFSQKYIRKLMSEVPTYMTLDDHEIEDDWPLRKSERDMVIKFPAAMHAYLTYQLSHSPLMDIDNNRLSSTPSNYWYTYSDGCCEFFALDTRTERELSDLDEFRKIVSDEQFNVLKEFLTEDTGRVKFVFSSVPFFPDGKQFDQDKWSGFLKQRTELLEFIRINQIRKVVFLTGDLHLSVSSELRCDADPDFKIISIISSPFFWPYRHRKEESLSLRGPITTDGSTNITYSVGKASKVTSEDNFTRIDVSPEKIRVRVFSRKGEPRVTKTHVF